MTLKTELGNRLVIFEVCLVYQTVRALRARTVLSVTTQGLAQCVHLVASVAFLFQKNSLFYGFLRYEVPSSDPETSSILIWK